MLTFQLFHSSHFPTSLPTFQLLPLFPLSNFSHSSHFPTSLILPTFQLLSLFPLSNFSHSSHFPTSLILPIFQLLSLFPLSNFSDSSPAALQLSHSSHSPTFSPSDFPHFRDIFPACPSLFSKLMTSSHSIHANLTVFLLRFISLRSAEQFHIFRCNIEWLLFSVRQNGIFFRFFFPFDDCRLIPFSPKSSTHARADREWIISTTASSTGIKGLQRGAFLNENRKK